MIKKIKAPLQQAIQNAARLVQMAPALLEAAAKIRGTFGDITKENTINPNAHCLIEHKARFMEYAKGSGREALLSAAYDILIAEVEHDCVYRDWMGAELEWIIKDILAGKWQERTNGHPCKPYWNEPAPFGGKYSIVNKLKVHRLEILKIIGEEL